MARMRASTIASVLFTLGAACCAWKAGLDRVFAGPRRPVATAQALRFDRVCDLGELEGGTVRRVEVRFSNDGADPVHIAGSLGVCGRGLCPEIPDLPLAIAPGESRAVEVSITLAPGAIAGETSHEMVLYTDAPGQTEVVLRFTGRWVKPSVE